MGLSFFDLFTFVAFIVFVVVVSLWASRRQETSEDYFLAGRGLTWSLIGFSLIASNISTEHFVGMAGEGFKMGLAIASYEWIAAVTLVFVALVFLPMFLRSGIYTIPEFLEYRFNATARSIMAIYIMLMYVVVAISSILYAGSLALKTLFGLDLWIGVWLIGILAGAYTIFGGLKAVVWSDLIQGAALIICGAVVTVLGFQAVGGVGAFFELSADKLHMFLPADHPEMPWTIFLGGIWIPNIFYWGLNQFITQRTLGAKSLAQGQKGVLFAAFLKLLIPFIIVFPGIMAWEVYGSQIPDGDQAYPFLIKEILPAGLRGIMFAALFGAVMSSLDSMLNSAATIFTMDVYKRLFRPEDSARRLLVVGRVMTAVFVLIGCAWAPFLDSFRGIFHYIQMAQGFISPGIVAVFLFGLVFKKAPPLSAILSLILTVPVYGLCLLFLETSFLNCMLITLVTCMAAMLAVTLIRPLPEPVKLETRTSIDLTSARSVWVWSALVVVATIALYIVFR